KTGRHDNNVALIVDNEDRDILEKLIQYGAPKQPYGYSALSSAIQLRGTAIAEMLLKYGVPTDAGHPAGFGLVDLVECQLEVQKSRRRPTKECEETLALLQKYGVKKKDPALETERIDVTSYLQSLKSSDPAIRWLTVEGLRNYGPLAKDAVPALLD